jgi:TRAP-type C4-dicarboxylate transport system permease small subunit
MSNEIIQYMHIPLVYLSAAYVTLDHGHTSIDLVTSKFPISVRKGLRIFGNLMGVGICGFISYRAFFVLVPKHIASHATINSVATGWPVWPFSLAEAVGFLALAVSFLWAIVRILAKRDSLSLADPKKTEQEVEDNDI